MFHRPKSEGLANAQFLCVLNVFVGGSKEQSRAVVMSEFLRNLSVQALNKKIQQWNLILEK